MDEHMDAHGPSQRVRSHMHIHTYRRKYSFTQGAFALPLGGNTEKENAVRRQRRRRWDTKETEREGERERSAAKRRARRQIVEQCLRSDIHMFAEVGLHLENRITVCPVRRPGGKQRGGRGGKGKGRSGSKTMKLRCTCTPRAQVAFQVRLPSRWSRCVVTMRHRDCKIDGTRNPFLIMQDLFTAAPLLNDSAI